MQKASAICTVLQPLSLRSSADERLAFLEDHPYAEAKNHKHSK